MNRLEVVKIPGGNRRSGVLRQQLIWLQHRRRARAVVIITVINIYIFLIVSQLEEHPTVARLLVPETNTAAAAVRLCASPLPGRTSGSQNSGSLPPNATFPAGNIATAVPAKP